jgi:hypothetical protein
MRHVTLTEISVALIGGVSAFLVNLIWMEMVDLLNQAHAEKQKLSYYSSTPWNIAKRYAQIEPNSHKPRAIRICMAITFACFAAIVLLTLFR